MTDTSAGNDSYQVVFREEKIAEFVDLTARTKEEDPESKGFRRELLGLVQDPTIEGQSSTPVTAFFRGVVVPLIQKGNVDESRALARVVEYLRKDTGSPF